MELITASRMGALAQCPRRHYWAYEVGLKATSESKALTFGTAWHSAMELLFQGEDPSVLIIKLWLDDDDSAMFAGLLSAYMGTWGSAPVSEWQSEVEFSHTIPGIHGWRAAGKIDGVGKWNDKVVLLEHKTTSDGVEPTSDYWLRLRSNLQVSQYVVAMAASGIAVDGVIYDVVRKPRLKRKDGEGSGAYSLRIRDDVMARPEFYMARREVPILEQELEDFLRHREVAIRSIRFYRSLQQAGSHPCTAWPRSVDGLKCKMCPYSGFCLQGATPMVGVAPEGFKIAPAHSELGCANKGGV
jgi:hypothetical protein